ncbi:MAG TPA: hypothetical protein VGN20_11095 [Mucilaginibacter sp.]|jgi:uncharacterized membrane protein YphA (DoxX/SURF4 family)
MNKFITAARLAYCAGLAGMVFPQFFYGEFGANFFPKWPGLPLVPFWTYLFTVISLAACIAIAFEKKGRIISLILGGLLLAMYCLGDIPYELIIDPYNKHLGSWGDGLKELALAGGAFAVAASFPEDAVAGKSILIKWLEKLIPFGRVFFCTTMILYGICHFFYTQPISTLVPNWIPGHIFWTYFAGVALIGLGFAIVLRIRLQIAAMLLGAIILIWLIILHIPMAIADPWGNKANSIVSSFSALAFIGTAFVIAGNAFYEKWSVALRHLTSKNSNDNVRPEIPLSSPNGRSFN